MKSNNTLYMKRPASWPGDCGREATFLGNGKTGALVFGGAGKEQILFNRGDLWYDLKSSELPRLTGALQKTRELIDAGDYANANDYMYHKLVEAGYESWTGRPFPLGCLEIDLITEELFTDYHRDLHMDKAESEIYYTQGARHVTRKCFLSRKNDTLYCEYDSDCEQEAVISFGLYDDATPGYYAFRDKVSHGMTHTVQDNGIDFRVKTNEYEYGAKVRVYGAEMTVKGGSLHLCAKHFRIAVKCCSGARSLSRLRAPEDFNYEERLKEHLPLHRRLYNAVDINLGMGRKRSNEELLEEAYSGCASPELIEKMWRFGRYLYISGVCKSGLPLTLHGLWHSSYKAMWTTHTANENVQIINWHADAGGLSELVVPLIDYLYSCMDIFRENADKLFGCRGIYVGAYFSPGNNTLSTFVPVILNYTGAAGWLAQHMYKYYFMTGDRKLLDEKIFPFMLEAADFYLDYITYDQNGKIVYYPGVSPENTPSNLITPETKKKIHDNPVTKNPVMEIAIVKELFTNLITLIKETGEHEEYLPRLTKAMEDMPEYMINSDGALKEWAIEELKDNYAHRHVSHIYPLFPGEEITKEDDPVLYAATERAVDLRKLGAQSGWSLAHTASIYAVLERGDSVLRCLDALAKGCMLNNLVTLHTDYRNMGAAGTWLDAITIQLDANMGAVNAVQMMLIDERKGILHLLPAPTKRLAKGSASGLRFSKGTVSVRWNLEKKEFQAKVSFKRAGEIRIKLPGEVSLTDIKIAGGTYEVRDSILLVKGEAGAELVLEEK